MSGVSKGTAGPPLDNIASNAAQRRPGYSAEDYVRESILNPNAYTAGTKDGLNRDYPHGLMTNFLRSNVRLSQQQFEALVAYLMSLK